MEPPDIFERYLDPKDRVTVRVGADGRPSRGPAGTILIDGEPISDADLQQYRKRLRAGKTKVVTPLAGSRLQETDRLDFTTAHILMGGAHLYGFTEADFAKADAAAARAKNTAAKPPAELEISIVA